MRARPLLPTLLAFVTLSLALPAGAQTTVESFAPQGVVKGVRQVQARFSSQVVAFGDLRTEDPFDIDCAQPGKGRWVDGSNWSYDFERDLPAGVACRFRLKPALRDLAGAALQGERTYTFSTGGPAVIDTLPYEGGQVDEGQIFVLGLDAPAREATIAAHAWCRAAGINEKIPVRVLAGAEREQVLANRKNFLQRHLHAYYLARGVAWKGTVQVKNSAKDKLPVAVLQCARTLPAKAEVTVVWGAGIMSDTGIATTEDQPLAWRTRPDFAATLSCDRLRRKGPCMPITPLRLSFSAPVPVALAKGITLSGPGGKSYPASFDTDLAKTNTFTDVQFPGPFPANAALQLQLPAGLKDDAGRTLVNAARFPLTVRTGEQPPLIKFPARFGIIEAKGDRLLPVTVRNVAAAGAPPVQGRTLRVTGEMNIVGWLRTMNGGGHDDWEPGEQTTRSLGQQLLRGRGEAFTMPKPGGRKAFEVVGIPLRKPGFYVVELASPKLGAGVTANGGTAYVSSAALVTNMVAHFKHGASSSLVWVTSLDQGRPVPRAKVAVWGCTGKLLWQGATDGQGVARIDAELPEARCSYEDRYFVTARSGDDFTFTLSNWRQGIETWRFNVPTEDVRSANIIATTVFDRTLLRAGETVHMKHFLRRRTAQGFELVTPGQAARVPPGGGNLPAGLQADLQAAPPRIFVLHEGSDDRFELPISWSANGSAAHDWTVPKEAKQGWYQVMLGGQEAGRFRVEQFRVPTMKALLQGPRAPAVQAAAVPLDLQLSYLSGGGAGGAQVRLATVVEPKAVDFPDYADFSFAAGDVKVGVERPGATFDEDDATFDEEEEAGETEHAPARTRNVTLDRSGGARVTVDGLPQSNQPRELLAEMSWQDANGETLTSSTRIPLWPSKHVIGIQPDGWVMSKKTMKFTVAVLDVAGNPVSGADVTADFFKRETYSHRRRLIGGFYSYENSSEVKALGQACTGRTDAKGLLICAVPAPEGGNLIVRAATRDAAGHAAVTQREMWVADREDWWFHAADNDRIDLLPQQKRYEPGQDATFQLRMPFRAATALITVEREGILDTYVRELSGTEPVFSIPMKKAYAPNVYVSALVVRGRVAGLAPTALVDLGKPAYKLGITPIKVGWAANELKVDVAADKAVYKVREKAAVTVKVTRADGSVPPAGTEIALAAVDVGLLELMPNASWELLETMMRQRSLQVQTATAQMQVVGKRHYGRKAVPSGGGGGKGAGRELFDTLLFWQASVKLDARGLARVEVPLNDALTAFRIVAIASGGAGLFGTGRTEITSSQDLMLLSGLPPLVREGDRLRAGFTVRNASQAAIQGELRATMGDKALPAQRVSLAPGQAQEVGWDVAVPVGVTELAWEVSAVAGAATDKLRVRQQVKPAVPVTTLQATLVQLDGPQSMTVQAPADAVPGRGGIRTLFTSQLGGELPGVRDYMLAYPYICLEQSASRAVALGDKARWAALAEQLPAYLDGDGLAKYFTMMEQGSDVLTAYLLSVSDEAGFELPSVQKERMEAALEAFVEGRIVRGSPLATADLAVRKVAALEALSRAGRVRPEMLESFTIAPNLWPTSAVIDWYLILHRTSDLPEQARRKQEAEQILKARLNLQGTTMTFSTERKDNWWWLMASADANANRLLLAMLDNPGWHKDMGRLARGALGRHRKGHWDTTVANAWGVLALNKFSRQFEAVTVTGSATAALGSQHKAVDLKTDTKSAAVMLPWTAGAASLELRHAGTGKPWATVQSLAAVPLKTPLSSGYGIRKTVTPVEQRTPGTWSKGDVYRVRLDLEAQSDMTWVVVDDPIPASATVLGSGLGGDSRILAKGEKTSGWTWPAFQERTFDAFRSYYEFVPKGKWSVEYTVRINNAGTFNLPPTRVEAMYSPEMFGMLPNAPVTVK